MLSNEQILVSKIKESIPIEILTKAYCDTNAYYANRVTIDLDHILLTEIINNKVLRDCNLVRGVETIIDLTKANREILLDNGLLIRLDPATTNGKNIISVLSVSYIRQQEFMLAPTIASSFSGTDPLVEPRAYPVAPFTIFVHSISYYPTTARVVLELSKSFTDVDTSALNLLGKMCVNATKADIYNLLRIKIANSVIVNGEDLPNIANIVSEYADASTIYEELRDKDWYSVSLMSDRPAFNRLLRVGIPQ
jgi:hypothetical protein